ncbi:hypothetical protein MKX08_005250 [Trichoderma sp. CBMAI-0020]|nr:hypothetical protein MKX08_005250 [Trichoderma sp. CBMAI-0020]
MPPSSVARDETLPLFQTPAVEAIPPLIPMPTQAPVAGQGTDNTQPNILIVFPAITIGTFLAAADGTIVLVSYVTISSELDALNMVSYLNGDVEQTKDENDQETL